MHARGTVGTRFSGESWRRAGLLLFEQQLAHALQQILVAQIDEANDAFPVDEVGRRPTDDIPL